MTRKGQAEIALGAGLVFSAVGGLFGTVVLILAAPALAEFALKFSSFEYFWLAALGLSATVMVSRGSQAKGALAMLLGLFLSTIGVDITLGYPRFTFGNVDLLNGISFIPALWIIFTARSASSGPMVKLSPMGITAKSIPSSPIRRISPNRPVSPAR